MRVFQQMVLVFLAGFCLTVSGVAHANPQNADRLAGIEAQGLKSVNTRLKRLITQPPAPAGHVQFSRDWVDSQPRAQGSAEWRCLAEALYFEARGETVKGQFAVAEVIMNRVKSARYPATPCAVIHQGTGRKYQCQFTYTCDGHSETISEPVAYERVSKVARAILDDRAPPVTHGATHYHTTAVRPRWSKVFERTTRIGVHLFYRKP